MVSQILVFQVTGGALRKAEHIKIILENLISFSHDYQYVIKYFFY